MKTYLPIAAVFVAVILSGALSFRELTVLRNDNAVVSHSYVIQQHLQGLLSDLKDAETGQRGYLYTNNSEYLQPYNDARSAVDSTFVRLAELTKSEPRQRDELADIRVLLEKKLNEMDETVVYQKSGDSAKARALVETNAGFELMNQVRTAVGRLNTEQSLVLRDQQTKVRRSALWLYVMLAFTSLLILILLGLLSRALALTMRARNAEMMLRDDLQRSYESLNQILKSVAAGFIVLDRDASITYINDAARALLDQKANARLNGRPIWEVFPDAKADSFPAQLRKAVVAGKETIFENYYPKLSKWLEVHTYGSPSGSSIFLIDVSLRKQSETALRKAEQLAVAGRFAATVAHEINNPLEAVTNLIYLASRDPGVTAGVLKYLDLADKELGRVAHMTKQTLGFYREAVAPNQFSIGELLEELVALFDGRFKSKGLSVQREYDANVLVTAVRGEIRQIFANLLVNAIDAAPHDGKIRIRVAADRDNAQIQFVDNGPGVPEQDVEKIFEPFFTTKKDVGTGLGLWVAKDLAVKHGGKLELTRVPAGGACFEVRLPGASISETLSVQMGR
jgi:PAS domain S-box-containing protein